MFDSASFSTGSFSTNSFEFGEVTALPAGGRTEGRVDPYADIDADFMDVVNVVILSGVFD